MGRVPLLNIEDYHVVSMAVEPDADFDPERGEVVGLVTARFSFELHSENRHAFRGNLEIDFGPNKGEEDSNLPFRARVALVGYFQTPIELVEGELPRDLAANALLVLYGIARGLVGQATANAAPPYKKLVLPAVVFEDIFNQTTVSPATNRKKTSPGASGASGKSASRKKSKSRVKRPPKKSE